MSGPNGQKDLTWDSASSAFVVFGITRVPVQKISAAKITIKIDKPARVGESLPSKRTPGKGELGAFNVEVLATDYEASILPRMPKHGGTLIQFPILINMRHPAIFGSLSVILDDCRILEIDGPELDGSEKGLLVKLNVDAMRRYDKGRDGTWKGLAYDPRRASSEARALMQF